MDYPDSGDLHNGKFTDGDPVGGIPASAASADHMNAIYDEIINAIVSLGMTPDKEKKDQLKDALAFCRNASNLNAGTVPLERLPSGSGKGLDADKLDGVEGRNYSKFYHYAKLENSSTTELLINELQSKYGCFKGGGVSIKVAWDYAGSSDLNTGDEYAGTIELAGSVIETWGDNATKNIRITRPTTGLGGKKICIYNDQGSGYEPGWEVIWGSGFMGHNSGLDADLLDGKQGSEYLIDLTGSLHLFATATAPTGFLKANGAEVSRTSYAKLRPLHKGIALIHN